MVVWFWFWSGSVWLECIRFGSWLVLIGRIRPPYTARAWQRQTLLRYYYYTRGASSPSSSHLRSHYRRNYEGSGHPFFLRAETLGIHPTAKGIAVDLPKTGQRPSPTADRSSRVNEPDPDHHKRCLYLIHRRRLLRAKCGVGARGLKLIPQCSWRVGRARFRAGRSREEILCHPAGRSAGAG